MADGAALHAHGVGEGRLREAGVSTGEADALLRGHGRIPARCLKVATIPILTSTRYQQSLCLICRKQTPVIADPCHSIPLPIVAICGGREAGAGDVPCALSTPADTDVSLDKGCLVRGGALEALRLDAISIP